MSSKYVRDAFRASWPGLVPTIPLFETINADPDHSAMPDLWATVEFTAFNDQQISLGNPSCHRENGTIRVVLSTRAGVGDNDITDAADVVSNAYRYWEITDLRVIQVDPPLSTDGFSDGMWYIMDIDISYDYDRFI